MIRLWVIHTYCWMFPDFTASNAFTRISSGDRSKPPIKVGWYFEGPYEESNHPGLSCWGERSLVTLSCIAIVFCIIKLKLLQGRVARFSEDTGVFIKYPNTQDWKQCFLILLWHYLPWLYWPTLSVVSSRRLYQCNSTIPHWASLWAYWHALRRVLYL